MKLEDVVNIIDNKFSGNINMFSENNEINIDVNKNILPDFCRFLKNNKKIMLTGLMDISGVDYLDYGKNYWETTNSTVNGFSRGHKTNLNYSLYMIKRFCVSYHLLSYYFNFRIRLRVFVDLNDMCVPSVVDIWPTANWHEREVYDFFGVIFTGHPNLIRILTDYGFEGHPLRKDFPLTGYTEVRYIDSEKRVLIEEVTLSQDFRNFFFKNT